MLFAAHSPDRMPRPAVLLVEDHEDTRQMYAEFLGLSFDMTTAGDVSTALRHARTRRPDVVVTDVSLPGVDGFGLIAAFRSDPALAAVPIVCLSGFGGLAYEERAHAAGCDRIIQKPCLPDELVEVISKLLGDRGHRSLEP
jgi:CheY-like chemotaxis protein